jgi:2-dehydropantoate 2-reductase
LRAPERTSAWSPAELAAMRENGLKLLFGEEAHVVQPRSTHNPIALEAQDFVIICFKAHSIPLVLDQMRPLLGPRTRIVTAVNGIPYWYFYRHGDVYENTILDNVDPGGRQWRELGPDRAIGCIIYPATEIEAPGVIKHLYGNHFPLGEPSCDITADVRLLSDQFAAAGLKAPVRDRIRDEIWLKLWGNVCFNPISALTHATLDVICCDPATRALSRATAASFAAPTLATGRPATALPGPVFHRLDCTSFCRRLRKSRRSRKAWAPSSASTSNDESRARARSARTRPLR